MPHPQPQQKQNLGPTLVCLQPHCVGPRCAADPPLPVSNKSYVFQSVLMVIAKGVLQS